MAGLPDKSNARPASPFRGWWLLATILILLLVGLFVRLGTWQLGRRADRLAANAQIVERTQQPLITVTGDPLDPDETDLRRATVRGEYDYANEIVLRNRTWNEYPGVHTLTPLRIEGSDAAILVDRGWIPYEDASLEAGRAVFRGPPGVTEVYGILRKSQERRGNVSPQDPVPAAGTRVDAWHRVDLPKIRQQLPYPLQTMYLAEDSRAGETPRAFPKPQPEIDLDEGSHTFYAIQWFAFAIIALVGYAALYRQRTQGRPRTKGEQTT